MRKPAVAPLLQSAARKIGPGSLATRYIENETVESFATRHRLKVRIDVDGTTIVSGKFGSHIYEDDPGKLAVMYFAPPTGRGTPTWNRRRKSGVAVGMLVSQDGDGEGSLVFDPMNLRQAKAAIEIAGLKRLMSEAQRNALAKARSRLPREKVVAVSTAAGILGRERVACSHHRCR